MALGFLSLPFSGPTSSAFGRRWLVLPTQPTGFWNNHEGCDWARGTGTPVRAAGDGVVYDNVFTSLKGHQLGIQHADGYRTRYHMLRDKALPAKGKSVKAGEIIGYVGMSGTAATGPHLHFELHKDGVPINPTLSLSYREAILAGNGSKPITEENDVGTIDPDQFNALIARLDIATGILGGLQNAVGDPKKGILAQSNVAADQSKLAADRAEGIIQHVAGPGGIKNTLNDPTSGVWPQVNKLVGMVDALSKAVADAKPAAGGNVTITLTQKEYDTIAQMTVDALHERTARKV